MMKKLDVTWLKIGFLAWANFSWFIIFSVQEFCERIKKPAECMAQFWNLLDTTYYYLQRWKFIQALLSGVANALNQ